MAEQNGSKPKQTKFPPIPSEWKVELPEEGSRGHNAIGGCRSIEEGYDRQSVLGQGTYGEVYKAIDLETEEVVAAKKIKMDNEKEGFPITAIREIKILSALAHSNSKFDDTHLRDHVITLREIVRSAGHRSNNYKGSIYMIFDYMDHDMTGLLARSRREGPPFSVAQIKCYMRQLLFGLSLLQVNKVLHRDLKNSNLLINNHGILKIGDFGLARYQPHVLDDDEQAAPVRMTNRVITLWYRPPELLLGAQSYGPEIDIWSAGCIMFELLTSKPLFSANDELGMCDKIFSVVGKATEGTMPGCTKFSNYQHIDFNNPKYPNLSRLRNHLARFGIPDKNAMDLMEGMLQLDPQKRIGAKAAASHPWFYSEPLPMDPSQIPKYASSHEMGMKRARQFAAGGAGNRRHFGPPAPKHQRMAPSHSSGNLDGQGGGPPPPHQPRGSSSYPGPQAPYITNQYPMQHSSGRQPAQGAPSNPMPPPAPYRGPPPGVQPPPAAWQSQRR